MTDSAAASRFVRWQVLTGAALLLGYGGYYICRSNLSVSVPALVADGATGLDRGDIGLISSAGIVAYAAGKAVTGIAGDFFGGRMLFLGGLFLSVLATLGFSVSHGLPAFAAFWVFNRFVQSAGWGGVTKTAAHWYPAGRYGAVMSLLSLSYLFGDAAGRYVLGALMTGGTGWRGIFISAAVILAVLGIGAAVVLRDSPRQLGFPEPEVSSANVFGADGAASRPASLGDLLGPYFAAPAFWLVCAMAFGMTLIREAFNTWIPAYLVDAHQLDAGLAAEYSALFPLLGGVSAIAVGLLTDRAGSGNRITLVVPAMGACALSLVVLGIATVRHDLWLSLAAICGTALFLLGPYTLLAGAVAMDMGGRKGSATAAGLIDTAGYAGGTLSGVWLGRLAETGGWPAVFTVMALISAGVALVAFLYWLEHKRRTVWRLAPTPELS